LTELPGVGKKTASMVVLGAFGQPAVVVDRHVLRVLNRLGFSFKDADVAEEEIRKMLPPEYWGKLSYSFMRHGPLKDCCPSSNAGSNGNQKDSF